MQFRSTIGAFPDASSANAALGLRAGIHESESRNRDALGRQRRRKDPNGGERKSGNDEFLQDGGQQTRQCADDY
jgi:hypothetical protein